MACLDVPGPGADDFRPIDSFVKEHSTIMTREYTKNEVERHCTADDLWIIFDGKVYNMTPYFSCHPGGSAMLRQAGKDASAGMRSVQAHGLPWTSMMKKLEELCIGTLKK